MNKPGSHRGAASSKKKKHMSSKKPKLTPAEKLLKFVQSERDRINKLIQQDKHYSSISFSCKEISEMLNMKISEVREAVCELYNKDEVSMLREGKYFSLYGIEYKEQAEKVLIQHFIYNKCPICEAKLIDNEPVYSVYAKHYGNRTVKNRVDLKCSSDCFSYKGTIFGSHEVKIFDKVFTIPENTHKSVLNSIKNDIKKEINRMRKDYRYVAEILVRK